MHKDLKAKQNKIFEVLNMADSYAVMPHSPAGDDALFAAAGLYHILKEMNKEVSFIYPYELSEEVKEFIDLNDHIYSFDKKDLIVAVNYGDTTMERVQYNVADGVFYLKIGPIARDFDLSKVRAGIHGLNSQVFITIGAQTPQDYGSVYEELKEDLSNKLVINFDNTNYNSRYGHLNVVDPLISSLSQLVLSSMGKWDIPIPKKAAEALLKGISVSSRVL